MVIAYCMINLFFLLWPIWTVLFLFKNYPNLEDRDFNRRYHVLYDDLRSKSFGALAYQSVFAIRRWDIILVNHLLTKDSPLYHFERSHYYEKVVIYLVV